LPNVIVGYPRMKVGFQSLTELLRWLSIARDSILLVSYSGYVFLEII